MCLLISPPRGPQRIEAARWGCNLGYVTARDRGREGAGWEGGLRGWGGVGRGDGRSKKQKVRCDEHCQYF